MGYHPNAMATALAQRRSATRKHPITSTIAWINFWEPSTKLREHLEFDAYWKGAYEAAEEYGYRLEEFAGPLNTAFLKKLDGIFRNRGISAILLPPQQHETRVESFPWEKYYAVRFGSSVQYPPLHLVTAYQSINAALALQQITSCGYKRVGYIMNRDLRGAQWLHVAGYLAQQFGLDPANRLTPFKIDPSADAAVIAELKAWIRREKPDAIISDMSNASDYIRRAGYRIPEDLGMAALSQLDGRADCGINQNSLEIGRQAIRQLVSLIHIGERGVPAIPRHTLIPGVWVQGTMLPQLKKEKIAPGKEKSRTPSKASAGEVGKKSG
jgi:DNA-binding LacI/PurR family transcriptional regulator